MNGRAAAPGGLALVESLVNTLDVESGTDTLDTPTGRAPFGLTGDGLAAARELREALRAACLAHAGQPPPPGAPTRDRSDTTPRRWRRWALAAPVPIFLPSCWTASRPSPRLFSSGAKLKSYAYLV
ncbi:hypothetical protein SSCG_04167 [Streptomyces clavuligerus]|nr:hypothetical protein SSCG_04167 [Streptomyces clavuligerus]